MKKKLRGLYDIKNNGILLENFIKHKPLVNHHIKVISI